MTNTILWTAFYALLALGVVAIVVRWIAGVRHRNDPRGPYGRRPRK
jgi:hypothetical protein